MQWIRNLIAAGVMTSSIVYAQNVKEGTPEFECLKTWSTGYEYWKNQEYHNAIPYLFSAMQCDKTLRPEKEKRSFSTAYEKIADSYVNLKNADSAVIVYKMGHADLGDINYIYKIGEMYHKHLLKFDSAAYYYREYWKLSGSNEELKRIAGMWIEAAKYKDAVLTYKEYLQRQPQDTETWMYVLDAFKSFYIKYLGKEDWLAACDTFSYYNPNASRDFYIGEKLNALITAGKYEEAIKTAQEILEKDPKSKNAWIKMGEAYDALQKRKEAIEALTKANEVDDKDADLLCKLARLYLDDGKPARAWDLCAKAKDLKKFGMPYFLIGEAIRDGIKACSGNVLDIPAKEAYLVAAKYFDLAAQYPDVEANAKSMASFCRQNGPTKSDCFLGSLGKLKTSSCYAWMPDKEYANPCK